MSSEIKYKYRIFCETDGTWEYEFRTTPPTVCPDDAGHTVNANSVNKVKGPTIVSLSIPMKYKKKDLKDNVYTELTTYEFAGTNFCGEFKYAKLITRMDDNGSGSEGDEDFALYLQIYDITNNVAILTSDKTSCSTIAAPPLTFDIDTVCSSDPAIWQISIKRPSKKSGDVFIKCVDFYFY
jgi:hypothetical protein